MDYSERIRFQTPDFNRLNRQGFTCIDMHVHSIYSDTFTTIKRILKKCKKQRIGVAITDHNDIRGIVKASKFKEVKEKEIMLVPGIEITSSEGAHLLIYFYTKSEMDEFYNKYIHKNRNKNPYTAIKMSAEDIIGHSSEYNCIVSLAHPFNIARTGIYSHIKKGRISERIMDNIDAVEVISSLCLRRMNKKAVSFCNVFDKGITAGSDAHSIADVGKAVTYSAHDSVESFLNSIKNKDNFVVGKETSNRLRAYTHSKSVVRHMRHPVNTVKVRASRILKEKITKLPFAKILNMR